MASPLCYLPADILQSVVDRLAQHDQIRLFESKFLEVNTEQTQVILGTTNYVSLLYLITTYKTRGKGRLMEDPRLRFKSIEVSIDTIAQSILRTTEFPDDEFERTDIEFISFLHEYEGLPVTKLRFAKCVNMVDFDNIPGVTEIYIESTDFVFSGWPMPSVRKLTTFTSSFDKISILFPNLKYLSASVDSKELCIRDNIGSEVDTLVISSTPLRNVVVQNSRIKTIDICITRGLHKDLTVQVRAPLNKLVVRQGMLDGYTPFNLQILADVKCLVVNATQGSDVVLDTADSNAEIGDAAFRNCTLHTPVKVNGTVFSQRSRYLKFLFCKKYISMLPDMPNGPHLRYENSVVFDIDTGRAIYDGFLRFHPREYLTASLDGVGKLKSGLKPLLHEYLVSWKSEYTRVANFPMIADPSEACKIVYRFDAEHCEQLAKRRRLD